MWRRLDIRIYWVDSLLLMSAFLNLEITKLITVEYFVFKAEFINLYWAAEIIPISEKICFISF